jgi:hypothetical protein
MFIGHYGVALGLKAADPELSLGELFVAVQLSDILFFPLVAANVERGTIVPGLTEASDLRLDYAPYTHGLVGALVLALIFYAIYQLIPRREGINKKRLGLVMAVGVFSHYVLDVIVHTPDMMLLNSSLPDIGLSLWKSAVATYIVEGVIVVGGLWIYQRITEGKNAVGKYGMTAFVGFMLLFNIYNLNTPSPDKPTGLDSLIVPAVLMYLVAAGIAFWLDRQRVLVEHRARYVPVELPQGAGDR